MSATSRVRFSARYALVFLGMGLLLPGAASRAADEQSDVAGWGRFVDPAGDCQVQQENGTVTISVPGTQHN